MRTVRRKTLGVTLAELMIAIAVLAIGLSGVAASLYFGFTKSSVGDDLATATQYSRMVIELVNGRNLVQLAPKAANGLPRNDSGLNDTPGAAPVAIDAPPLIASDFLAYPDGSDEGKLGRDLARYQRKIELQRFNSSSSTPEYNMARMKVTIYWEVKGVKKHASTTTVIPILP